MDGVLEHLLVGGDFLRDVIGSDGKDIPFFLNSIDDEFKVGEPAFIDCANLTMQPAGPVDAVRTRSEQAVTARSAQPIPKTFAGQSDFLEASQGRRQVDDITVLLADDAQAVSQIEDPCSFGIQTPVPGSYQFWLMRRKLLNLVEVDPALQDSVSIPFMHEQENKRWACVHAVMQGEKYMARCTSGRPIPRHPDPCDRAISKRGWEKSMRDWRQELGDV